MTPQHATRIGVVSWRERLTIGFALAVAAMACVVASLPAYGQEDLPGRVGRVALFQGDLLRAPEDSPDQWSPIGLNYPVTSGDSLWVGANGSAEVDYGGGQLRLGSVTNVHVSRLDDRQLALFVEEGRIIVRVRFLDPADSVRVDTPSAQVTLLRPGLYRVDVAPQGSGPTNVTVREGEAAVAVANAVQQLLPGQMATIDPGDPSRVLMSSGSGVDGFDTWSASRDRIYERSDSTAYVSREMVGYADLDGNGAWENYPEYGAVWFPTTVAAGWAPYRYGHWVTLPVWGPTWVDDAPWGYAPFHYGRWVYVDSRWGWCPGAYVARPVWAPALVAWYGGSGWSVSATYGGPVYGWVPLAWREPFQPWWGRCSSLCWTHYNRPYAVNPAERNRAVAARYVNWSAPGGVTAVAGAAFVGGRSVQNNIVTVPARAVNSAPMLRTAPVPRPQPATAMVRAGSSVPYAASSFNPSVRRNVSSPVGSGSVEAPMRTPVPAGGGSDIRRGSVNAAPAYAAPSSTTGGTRGPAAAAPSSASPANSPRFTERRGIQPEASGSTPVERTMRTAPTSPSTMERAPRVAPPTSVMPREYRSAPQAAPSAAPLPREYRPAPQSSAPAMRAAPAPQAAPAPAMRSAPAPQAAPAPAMRSAPAPQPPPAQGGGGSGERPARESPNAGHSGERRGGNN